MQMSIAPPLNNLYYEYRSITPVRFNKLDTNDGSSVTFRAMENPDLLSDEQLQFNLI